MSTRHLKCKVSVVPLKFLDGPVLERLATEVSGLLLAPGQAAFVGEPAEMLATALADSARHPFAILASPSGSHADKVVGMGVLHVGVAAEAGWQDADDAVLLRGFLIDRSCQGLGYGAGATLAAVNQAADLVRRFGLPATGVVLSVNERNLAGRAAYLKAGFMDRGQYLGGRSGPQRTLHLPFVNKG